MLKEEHEQLAETNAPPGIAEQYPKTDIEPSENESTAALWNYFDELVKEQNSDEPASTPKVEAVVMLTWVNQCVEGKVIHRTTGSKSYLYGQYFGNYGT